MNHKQYLNVPRWFHTERQLLNFDRSYYCNARYDMYVNILVILDGVLCDSMTTMTTRVLLTTSKIYCHVSDVMVMVLLIAEIAHRVVDRREGHTI